MIRVFGFVLLFASAVAAGDVSPDRKPENSQPPPTTETAPACQCGGAGQCCGQTAAADAQPAEPRKSGCSCGRARANAERK